MKVALQGDFFCIHHSQASHKTKEDKHHSVSVFAGYHLNIDSHSFILLLIKSANHFTIRSSYAAWHSLYYFANLFRNGIFIITLKNIFRENFTLFLSNAKKQLVNLPYAT